MVVRDGDRAPGRRPPPDSRHDAPPSSETSSGGFRSTIATIREPSASAATSSGQPSTCGRGAAVTGRRGSRTRPLRGRSTRSRTTSRRELAVRRSRRALAFGEHLADDRVSRSHGLHGWAPSWRADRYATMNASPAPVASTSGTGVAGTCVTSPSTHTSAPRRAERDQDLGDSEPSRSRLVEGPPATIVASSSESLSSRDVREHASGRSSRPARADRAPDPHEGPCPSSATRLPRTRARRRLGRKVAAQEGRDVDDRTSGSRWCCRPRRPRVADLGHGRPAGSPAWASSKRCASRGGI